MIYSNHESFWATQVSPVYTAFSCTLSPLGDVPTLVRKEADSFHKPQQGNHWSRMIKGKKFYIVFFSTNGNTNKRK